jgi:hypothetical protein
MMTGKFLVVLLKGKMGMSSAEGFYKYPNPSYADPVFWK